MMFERPHHQRIAQVLSSLNARLLLENNCLFGGGTAIALRYGEFRESVDMDFLISDVPGYRNLRQLLTTPQGIQPILKADAKPLSLARDIRADQYGIRTMLLVAGHTIKFEIVLEGRIKLSPPQKNDDICGIATLSLLDMATSKLLANSDRWNDEGAFNRDLIDLAMMNLPLPQLRKAVSKAEGAYGTSILADLEKAITKTQSKKEWLERCIQAMDINIPKAVIWKKIRRLRRLCS